MAAVLCAQAHHRTATLTHNGVLLANYSSLTRLIRLRIQLVMISPQPLLDAPWTQKGGAPEAPGSGQLWSKCSAWTISGALQWVGTVLRACAALHE
jgi:hypothetical protein